MNAFCLIPSINRPTLREAITSAYEWRVLHHIDNHRVGAGATRNILTAKAIRQGAEFIRYLDDDDLLISGNKAQLLAPFADPSVDAVIFGWIKSYESGISYLEVPHRDPRIFLSTQTYPWNAVFRASSLQKLLPFREDLMCRLGGWMWFKFFRAGLKVAFADTPGYVYRCGISEERLSERDDFKKNDEDFRRNLREWLNEHKGLENGANPRNITP